MDDNLYKYFAVNSLRSIYVLTVAIHTNFLEEIFLSLKENVEQHILSELAQNTKNALLADAKLFEKTKALVQRQKKLVLDEANKQNALGDAPTEEEKLVKLTEAAERVTKLLNEDKPNQDGYEEMEQMAKRIVQISRKNPNILEKETAGNKLVLFHSIDSKQLKKIC